MIDETTTGPCVYVIEYVKPPPSGSIYYVGMTEQLSRRLEAHRTGHGAAKTKRYGVKRVVWVGVYATRDAALRYEGIIHRLLKNGRDPVKHPPPGSITFQSV